LVRANKFYEQLRNEGTRKSFRTLLRRYADDPSRARPDHEMRISFGSASGENIRKGIARLGKVLKKFV
jgi:DNA-binding transcriptional MocR family regulator